MEKRTLKQYLSRDLLGEDRDASFKEIIKAYIKFPTYRLRVWLRIAQKMKRGGVIHNTQSSF